MSWRTIGICLIIWALALMVIHTGVRTFTGNDGILELWRVRDTMQYGWKIQAADQNNASLALVLFAPWLSNTFNLDVVSIFRNIFTMIYATTPVLLYMLFRRIMSPARAFVSTMFFIVLPPSYQEIPNIGKSMIAEPLAVGSLLFLTSRTNVLIRSSMSGIFLLLSITAHYTVGIILLSWHGIVAFVTGKRVLLAGMIVIMIIVYGYFAYVGDGAVLKGIISWWKIGSHQTDSVKSALTGGEYNVVGLYIYRLPFIIPSWVMTLIIRLATAILFAGGIYWCSHRKYLIEHRELSIIIVFSAMLVTAAIYIPFLTKGLYLSRWIQLAAIPMCGLYGMATYWVPRRWSYPIAGVILILLLAAVR